MKRFRYFLDNWDNICRPDLESIYQKYHVHRREHTGNKGYFPYHLCSEQRRRLQHILRPWDDPGGDPPGCHHSSHMVYGDAHGCTLEAFGALSLIIAGGVGNLADRMIFGFVTDMFDFRFFPVFNIADIAVCVGAGFMILYTFVYSSPSPADDREETGA